MMDAPGAIPLADPDAVVDAVRAARADRTPVRIRGSGSWLDAGRPVPAERTIDLAPLRGIIEYEPGDLTLTARAGTTLADIERATQPHGQWLPLDAFGPATATLGATLATASTGPLASSIGQPRDLALGITFVTGEGRLASGGGRVVKNVAGFDLVRLMVGAWGTLGVLVEATVRLRARPDADETVACALPNDQKALAQTFARVRSATLAPLAAELLSPRLAQRLGLERREYLLLRLSGNPDAVRAQRSEIASGGEGSVVSSVIWERLQRAEPASSAVVRFSRRPTELARLWLAMRRLLDHVEGEAHASLERGVVRCWLQPDMVDVTKLPAFFEPGDVRIFERLPSDQWQHVPARVDASPLSIAIRHAFDPDQILNPGILGAATP
jgi:glycolate dehydrogenase FAD-binding subunit